MALTTTGKRRDRNTVAELAALVHQYLPLEPLKVRQARVLEAWRAVAGLPKWTPEMVDVVEGEMRR